jgi:hypothetical protein
MAIIIPLAVAYPVNADGQPIDCPYGPPVPSGTDCAAAQTSGNCSKSLTDCDLISKYINPLIDFLSALVGVSVLIAIIVGGIQYSSSAGDPSKASTAKAHIRNAIIALIAFVLLYSMLNFLIPGGLV